MKAACKHLRAKKMYVPALEPPEAQAELESLRHSHCWCNRTLAESGPDDRPVGPQVCDPRRTCFEE